MVFLIAILLGLVQGLCEFLPVSSSGHLYLISKLTSGAVGEDTFGSFFTVMLHVATLIAVVIVYREQILSILKHPFQKLTLHLIIATLPTVVFALILKKWEEEGKYYTDENENKEKVALFTGCMVDYRAQEVGYAMQPK